MVNSKQKGNKFEIEILRACRKVDRNAHLVIGSGNAKDESGDIYFKNYMIECKHHRDLTDGQVERFFEKVERQAEPEDRMPLLIFKINRRKPKVMFISQQTGSYVFMYFEDWLEWERK